MIDLTGLMHQAPKIKARQMESYVDAIEAALTKGYTHSQVHAWLVTQGVEIDFRYYETALYRLRKKRKAQPTAAILPLQPSQAPGPKPEIHEAVGPASSDNTAGRKGFQYDVKSETKW